MTKVFIGVDPHKLCATIEIVDSYEKLLGSGRFSTDQAGYTAVRTYAKAWPERVWAVEGSNGARRPLAQRLLEAGEHVVDVPAKLAARVRLFDTGHNRKTDARDAHSIAIVAVRTNTLRVLRADGELEALRMPCDRRELEPVGDAGTRMTQRNRGQPPGFTGIAAPLLAVATRRANARTLANLKRQPSRAHQADRLRFTGRVPCRSSVSSRRRAVARGARRREFDMFVQVIQGSVSDAARVRAQLDKWVSEVAPGAVGWLGSTSGVTEDGRVVALARFESEEAAQQNADRPEQTAWWEEMAALFTDEPVFHNSTSVEVDTPGDPSQAGFVQVMQGRSSDPERARELMANDPTDWRAFRPDILGTLSVGHDGDAWTMAIYFTSEQAAREGEQKEPPPEMQEMMKEIDALSIGEPVFFDLKDPWLDAPS